MLRRLAVFGAGGGALVALVRERQRRQMRLPERMLLSIDMTSTLLSEKEPSPRVRRGHPTATHAELLRASAQKSIGEKVSEESKTTTAR